MIENILEENNVTIVGENYEEIVETEPEYINIVGADAIVDYEQAINKPKINNVELSKNKTFEELGFREITNLELNDIFKDL